jgi:hypothetical protein
MINVGVTYGYTNIIITLHITIGLFRHCLDTNFVRKTFTNDITFSYCSSKNFLLVVSIMLVSLM